MFYTVTCYSNNNLNISLTIDCQCCGFLTQILWCCYITVDSAMVASQNGFCSYNLSIHKKTNIMQIMTKNITIFIYLIFYHREIVKLLDHFMTLSLSYAKNRFVMQPFQNPPFCSSTESSAPAPGVPSFPKTPRMSLTGADYRSNVCIFINEISRFLL